MAMINQSSNAGAMNYPPYAMTNILKGDTDGAPIHNFTVADNRSVMDVDQKWKLNYIRTRDGLQFIEKVEIYLRHMASTEMGGRILW